MGGLGRSDSQEEFETLQNRRSAFNVFSRETTKKNLDRRSGARDQQ
jgi:hypothetical protein